MLPSYEPSFEDKIYCFTPKNKIETIDFFVFNHEITIKTDIGLEEIIFFVSLIDDHNNDFYGRIQNLFLSPQNIIIFTKHDLLQNHPNYNNILLKIEELRSKVDFPKRNMFFINVLDKDQVRLTNSSILLELIYTNVDITFFNQGLLFEQGVLVPRDIPKAIDYYDKSGDRRGYKNIYQIYKNGKYIDQNLTKAIEYCEKAGDSNEANLLKILYLKKNSKPKYEIINLLDSGAFGKIFLAKNVDHEIVVLKCIYCEDSNQINKGLKEYQFVTKMNHENIVSMNKVYIDIDSGNLKVMIEMKYYPKGSLFNHVLSQSYLSTEKVINYCLQILNGLEYIHKNNIVHRDMKPQNILLENVNDDIKLLISDFGESKYTQFSMKSTVGTPDFMAIEIIKGENYDSSVDIFSFGGIMYFMLTKEIAKLYIETLKKDWKERLISIIEKKEHPKELANIIYSCTKTNPKERPKIEEIKSQLNSIKL